MTWLIGDMKFLSSFSKVNEWNIFSNQHLKIKFCIAAWPCNILCYF